YVEADELIYAPSGGAVAAGVYEVGAVSGGTAALTRRADLDASADFVSGLTIPIREGDHAGKVAVFATTGAITLGATSLEFVIAEGEAVEVEPSLAKTADGKLKRADSIVITDAPYKAK